MKKTRLWGCIAAFVLAAGLTVSPNVDAHAAETADSDDKIYTEADKSSGVEYIYSSSGSKSGVNLNGNSVVIKNSDTEGMYNIYNDVNKNGEIDDGEKAFVVEGSEDVSSNSELPQKLLLNHLIVRIE